MRQIDETVRNAGRPRVVVADDHPAVRKAVENLISTSFDVIAAVPDGRKALDAVQRLDPDVVVLDITMPELDGFDVAKELRSTGARTKIVFLSGHHGDEYVQAAVEAGVEAFVVKAKMATDLPAAIAHVLSSRLRVPAPSCVLGIADARARHALHVGTRDDIRLDELAQFTARALRDGDRVVAVGRPDMRSGIASRLADLGFDVASLIDRHRYRPLDAEECLTAIMRGDEPDERSIVEVIRMLEDSGAAASTRMVVFGELASLLWRDGNIEGALAVERIWHRHASFHTLCSYCAADLAGAIGPNSSHELTAIHQTVSS